MSGGGQVVDLFFFFLNDPPPPDLSSLPPHAPLPISPRQCRLRKEALLFESSRQRSRVSGIRWSQYERPSFSSLQPDFIPSGHIHAGIQQHHGTRFPFRSRFEIGRASCRERV